MRKTDRISPTYGRRVSLFLRSCPFLLTHNGGRPAHKNINFPLRSGGSTLHTFYGIHHSGEGHDLEYEILKRRGEWLNVPENLIPIAYDAGGDLICLGIAGDEDGRVYFRESDRLPDEPNPKPWARMKGYARLADSFSEFLASLTPLEP